MYVCIADDVRAIICRQHTYLPSRLRRSRLSASPATGLIGLQENGFLSDFFGCMGFLSLASERSVLRSRAAPHSELYTIYCIFITKPRFYEKLAEMLRPIETFYRKPCQKSRFVCSVASACTILFLIHPRSRLVAVNGCRALRGETYTCLLPLKSAFCRRGVFLVHVYLTSPYSAVTLTHSVVRGAMMSIMLADRPQHSEARTNALTRGQDDEEKTSMPVEDETEQAVGSGRQTVGSWSEAVTADGRVLPRNAPTCLLWCAIALGALVRGCPLSHVGLLSLPSLLRENCCDIWRILHLSVPAHLMRAISCGHGLN